MSDITFLVKPEVTNDQLNTLFSNAWSDHTYTDFSSNIKHCLFYICGFSDEELIGYVVVAWDGGKHGFLLDTTIHKNFQHRGIGSMLVKQAIKSAQEYGLKWLHVDYEPHLQNFYGQCGFFHTEAGLVDLQQEN